MESDWDLVCAICIDILDDPVVADDTRIYCRKCIESWFRSLEERGLPRSSPWTRDEIGKKLKASPVVLDSHFMLAGANVPSILTLRSVFAHLDPLRDILAASLEGWQPPQVVMIGQESSGKSSILERLAMMPLFPRGDDITTRLPIHVHLRNAKTSLPPTLEVVDTATGKTVRGPYVVPSISGHLDVSQQMDEILREEQRGLYGVSSTRRIVVHIENRHVPSIDLVDLPGIVAAGENSAGTKALAETHIKLNDRHSIYLLTCPAAMGPNGSVALDMVIKQGLQARTVGVFTMCDEADSERQRKLLLQRLLPVATGSDANGGVPLAPHGWVATMTRPEKEENGFKRLNAQSQAEEEWFKSRIPMELAGRAGCGALMSRLGELFHGYLLTTWCPSTLQKIAAELEKVQVDVSLLGGPVLRGEPQRARDFAVAEALKVLAQLAYCEALLKPLRAEITTALQEPLVDLSPHLLALKWAQRQAAVEKACWDAAARWPKMMAEGVRLILERLPAAQTDSPAPKALLKTPPFVFARFPAFIEKVVVAIHAVVEVQATAAMAAAGRHVEQFFVGPSPFVRPTMSLENISTGGVEAQGERLAEGVLFAFVRAGAGARLGEAAPGQEKDLEKLLSTAAAAVDDAEWNENCAEERARLAKRGAELERAREGVTNMLAEVPEWSMRRAEWTPRPFTAKEEEEEEEEEMGFNLFD